MRDSISGRLHRQNRNRIEGTVVLYCVYDHYRIVSGLWVRVYRLSTVYTLSISLPAGTPSADSALIWLLVVSLDGRMVESLDSQL